MVTIAEKITVTGTLAALLVAAGFGVHKIQEQRQELSRQRAERLVECRAGIQEWVGLSLYQMPFFDDVRSGRVPESLLRETIYRELGWNFSGDRELRQLDFDECMAVNEYFQDRRNRESYASRLNDLLEKK